MDDAGLGQAAEEGVESENEAAGEASCRNGSDFKLAVAGIESGRVQEYLEARLGIMLEMKRLACEVSQIGDHQNACRVTRSRKREVTELALFYFIFCRVFFFYLVFRTDVWIVTQNETTAKWTGLGAIWGGVLLAVDWVVSM